MSQLDPDHINQADTLEKFRRMATVIQDSNDAITFQDLDGNILAWNRGAEQIYGYSEAEALSMNIVDTVPREYQAEAREFLLSLKRGELVPSLETKRKTKAGRIVDVWLTNTKLTDDKGALTGIATTERDITERNHSEASLREKAQELEFLRDGQITLSDKMRGEQDVSRLGQSVLSHIVPFLNAQMGAFYYVTERKVLKRVSGYAYSSTDELEKTFALGEGLVGQVALEKKTIQVDQVPSHYFGVIRSDLGESAPGSLLFAPVFYDGEVNGVIELASFSSFSEKQKIFLEHVSENIGIAINTSISRKKQQELLERSQGLTEELQSQQVELKATNDELEDQARALQESQSALKNQRSELEATNVQLEQQRDFLNANNEALSKAQTLLEERSVEIQRTSQYKSEFLANMSHELRTPLNSSLILAKLLADNVGGNLSGEQVLYAQSISSAGNDLLNLINDILDLSKVEAGMLEISPEVVSLPNLVASIERMFAPLARERNLEFHVKTESELPGSMFTDRRRLEQILKNLLSNAFKFTEKGQVTLQISRASSARLALTVIDTGIGVPKGQQEVIFEAFRQADGTTNRKYGGTGLGLSISRDLARLLGGTVEVESEVGVGSRFTLFLPQNYDESQVEVASPKAYSAPAGSSIPLPSRFEPHFVPSISLKTTSGLRQILIVEDDPLQSDAMIRLLESEGVTITAVASGAEALSALSRMDFACMVIDLKLPDMSGQDLLIQMTAQIEKVKLPPVIVYTGRSLTQDEENLLRGYSHSIVIKGACSPERLLDEVGTFLHPAELPAPPIAGLGGQEIHFKGTKILIVDDDVRNIFALSAALEQKGAQIKVARNGKEALVRLKEDASIELVLMDIMMPEMDGYQTTREIRKQTIFAKLPIIALTAKATKRDQDLCMAAGTSDYLAKPINLNHLFSLVRIWAPKSERK